MRVNGDVFDRGIDVMVNIFNFSMCTMHSVLHCIYASGEVKESCSSRNTCGRVEIYH